MSAVCPLCSQTFSTANIEAHASSCNGASTINVEGSNKRKLDSNSSSQSPKSLKMANLFPVKIVKLDSTPVHVQTSSKISVSKETESIAKPIVKPQAPLAERMRPSDFSSYFGQNSSLGPSSMLRTLLSSSSSIPSLILWGPPGCGKTTLANIIAMKAKSTARFVKMSACVCGVAEVRDVVKQVVIIHIVQGDTFLRIFWGTLWLGRVSIVQQVGGSGLLMPW